MNTDYLQDAKDNFDRSNSDVTSDYQDYLERTAKLEALLSIADSLSLIVNRLEQISTDLQNIEYTLDKRLTRLEENR